jgi:hypothetical protein
VSGGAKSIEQFFEEEEVLERAARTPGFLSYAAVITVTGPSPV